MQSMMNMRKIAISALAMLALTVGCKRNTFTPRPTIPLVMSIAADTTGIGHIAAIAGNHGADGSIAIIGDPMDAISLARHFQTSDKWDNIDGRTVRDSLPDFAGERFDVILDAYNEPYAHFIVDDASDQERPDSLREAAVQSAMFAWDSTCVRSISDPDVLLPKARAKILIFTSALQAKYGLFDVDTLQQLTGGRSILLSPVDILLDQAYSYGARNIAVWTSRPVRKSGAWQSVFEQKDMPGASLTVITPDSALDIRTEFRSFLRQYYATGKRLDALILDSYSADASYLASELALIRRAATDEDAGFDRMLPKDFRIFEPNESLLKKTYELLREKRLFTHRIARPMVCFFETDESEDGDPVLVCVDPSYVQNTYVQNLD